MAGKEDYNKMIGFGLRYVLPVVFTVVLLVFLFHKVDFRKMWELLSHGVDYWWILLAMALSIFSHIFRAARWRLQLAALGIKPPFMALCCSIFGCYALNLIFPRLGELWRCTYISSYKESSFPTVFGTMIGDRIADSITVGLLLVLTMIVAAPALHAFLDRYPMGRDLIVLISRPWFPALVIGACIFTAILLRAIREYPPVKKAKEAVKSIWRGFSIILRMKGRIAFIALTLCIWGCYFIQLYVAFYAFDFLRELCHTPGMAMGFIPCLVAFVFSSISMAVPSNGGLGPWNLAIMFALSIYGVTDAQGTAFSMLQWSGETVMLIILGIFTMIYISATKRQDENPIKLIEKEL